MRIIIAAALAAFITSPAIAQSTWQTQPARPFVPAPPPPNPFPSVQTPQGTWNGSRIGDSTYWSGPQGQRRTCSTIGTQIYCN